MLSGGVEFDVYVERWNKLVVPDDEVAAYSVVVEGVGWRASSTSCAQARGAGEEGALRKGDKDRGDVVQLGLMLGRRAREKLLAPYFRQDYLESLLTVAGSALFYELCGATLTTLGGSGRPSPTSWGPSPEEVLLPLGLRVGLVVSRPAQHELGLQALVEGDQGALGGRHAGVDPDLAPRDERVGEPVAPLAEVRVGLVPDVGARRRGTTCLPCGQASPV